MFQLIIAVVAILLIALLAFGVIYYGGSAHTESAIKAEYATNMNAAAQIEGAVQLYYQQNATYPPGEDMELLEHLVERGYLTEIPIGSWTVRQDTLYKPTKFQTVDECRGMNRVAGFDTSASDLEPYDGCPPCNGEEGTPQRDLAVKYSDMPVCQFIE